MFTRRIITLVVAIGITVYVAACGSDDMQTTQTDTVSAADSETTYEEPPAPSVASFEPAFRLVSRSEDDDGSTVNQRLEFADLVAASDFEAPRGFEPLVDICEVDRQRDVFVPGKLIAKNTTKGFPVEFDSGITVTSPSYDALVTDVAQHFADGPSCEPSESSDIVARVQFDIETGGSITHDFMVVLHDYFSPRYPNGNKRGLAGLRATFHTLYTGWTQKCLSSSAPLDGEFVRLDGEPITQQAYEPAELSAC